jgi:hypothetical protein
MRSARVRTEMPTLTYLFTDEEIADIKAAAEEHHIKVEELVRQAVLEKLVA